MPEQTFLQFKKSIKEQQFNDHVFLIRQAEIVNESNPTLSLRILQRAEYLQKQQARRLEKKIQDKQVELNEKLVSNNNKIDERIDNKMAVVAVTEKSKMPAEHKHLAVDKILNNQAKIEQQDATQSENNKPKWCERIKCLLTPFVLCVVLPCFFFSCYQIFWATERYESRTQLVIQQPDGMATMDAGMALLSGLGVNTTNSDAQLVEAYIYSNDMLNYLDEKINLREHYSDNGVDFFSRLHDWHSQEDVMAFYQRHVTVEIDIASSIIVVYVQAFEPDFSQKLAVTIANKAEWFINDIGHQLANAQLAFIQGEHALTERRLKNAQLQLLVFQQKHQLLNPEAEGSALASIAYGMVGEIAGKQIELKALQSIMSPNAPQVKNAKIQLQALKQQLLIEKQRLTQANATNSTLKTIEKEISISEVLAKFTDLKIELELALKGFASSIISLEKSRIEAYRQLKYLIVIEKSTRPESSSYPTVFYNVALLTILLLLLYGVGRIITATIRELK